VVTDGNMALAVAIRQGTALAHAAGRLTGLTTGSSRPHYCTP
jgi:hypothetical protein